MLLLFCLKLYENNNKFVNLSGNSGQIFYFLIKFYTLFKISIYLEIGNCVYLYLGIIKLLLKS